MRGAAIWLAACALAAPPASAQGLDGRWEYEEDGQTVTLDLARRPAGRVSGTLVFLGVPVDLAGRADASAFSIESLDGAPLDGGRYLNGRLEGEELHLEIRLGSSTSDLRLRRGGSAAGPAWDANGPHKAGEPAGGPEDFAGRWEATSEDGTDLHEAVLTSEGTRVSGTYIRAERGYFSGRVEVKEQLELRGEVRAGVLVFKGTLSTSDGETLPGSSGSAFRRGDYLVVRVGTYEVALAPPGVPLTADPEGSAEAAALARAVGGREYSSSTQAAGRDAFVGGRIRLALCSDGTIAYSKSDLVATPGGLPGAGVDGGSSWARRGRWTVVLYAGAPSIRADWEGTGTSYSLVEYIRVEPAADGRSAIVDGTRVPLTGRC